MVSRFKSFRHYSITVRDYRQKVPMNRVIKSSNMTLAWHVACRREKNVYTEQTTWKT